MGERPLVSSLLGSSRRFSQALGFAPPRPGARSAGGSHALRNDADPRADGVDIAGGKVGAYTCLCNLCV